MNLRKMLGWMLQSLALAGYMAAAIAGQGALHLKEDRGTLFVLFVVFGAVSTWLWRTGKRLRARSAAEVLDSDPRPPILYLRSFRSDGEAGKAPSDSLLLRFLPVAIPQSVVTEEEQIAEAMSLHGPFVAIGEPGEIMPTLGAARSYVGDKDWQSVVRDLMQRSRLVLLRVAKTPGFWWELRTAAESLPPDRLVLLLPTSSEAYREFRVEAQGLFRHPLPEHYDPRAMSDRSFGGLIWFDAQGLPTLVMCDTVFNLSRYAVAADLREKLAPLLGNAGTAPARPASLPRRLSALALDGLILAGCAKGLQLATDYACRSGTFADQDGGLLAMLASLAVVVFYFCVLEATPLRATPGKRLLRLRTLDRSGLPLAFQQSLLRGAVKVVGLLPTFLPFVSFGLAACGRPTLHDWVSRSGVYEEASRRIANS